MATVKNYVYSAGTYTVTIRHYANGGDTAPANVSKSGSSSASSVTIKANISTTLPTRAGYRFLGYAKSSGGSVVYQPGDQVKYTFTRSATYERQESYVEDDITYVTVYYRASNQTQYINLYAKWEAAGSTVSASDNTLGTQQTITVNRADPSYTHTIRYSFAGQTGTIATGVTTSCTWTPPLSLSDYIPSSESAACTIYCDTYLSDQTLYSTSQTTITLSVPSTVKCTISSVSLAEQNTDVSTKFSAFVQTKSELSVTGTFVQGSGSPTYGATVESVSININGQTLIGNGSITNLLQTSGTNAYSMTITDSRGRTDTYTGTFNVLAYNAPSISSTAERDATTNSKINVAYSWNISAVSDLNDKSITFTLESNGIVEDTDTITPASYSGTGTYSFTGTDISEPYSVTVECEDYFTTVQTSSQISAVGSRILHMSATDKTIAFHGANESDGKDHEHFPIVFHDKIEIGVGCEPLKTLWTGSWSSGDKTIAGLDKYTLFIVEMDGQGTRMLVISPPAASYFRGIGGYSSSSSNHTTYFIGANKSGTTLTMVNCHSVNQSGSVTARTVSAIIGVI